MGKLFGKPVTPLYLKNSIIYLILLMRRSRYGNLKCNNGHMLFSPRRPSSCVYGPFADPEDGLSLGADRGRSRACPLTPGDRAKR